MGKIHKDEIGDKVQVVNRADYKFKAVFAYEFTGVFGAQSWLPKLNPPDEVELSCKFLARPFISDSGVFYVV